METDKERIANDALQIYYNDHYDTKDIREAYIAGATAELQRVENHLKILNKTMKENSAHGFSEGSEVPKEETPVDGIDTPADLYANNWPPEQHMPAKCGFDAGVRSCQPELQSLRDQLAQRDKEITELKNALNDVLTWYWKQEYNPQHFQYCVDKAKKLLK